MVEWKQLRHRFRLVVIVVTVVVATVDIFSDWWLFKDFCVHGGGKLTPPLGIFCVISSVLFVMEIRNAVWSFRLYRGTSEVINQPMTPEQKRLDRWQETVSFLLLVFEDFPSTIIMYVAFEDGSCDIFTRIFEESFTGNLALLASFFSSLWKGMMSFCYCCDVCRCKFHDIHGACKYCCCCCCRFLRPVVAILLMGFTAYLYVTFDKKGTSVRPECFKDPITTLTSLIDMVTSAY